MTAAEKLRLGVSACLLGDKVRYDGGHKRDPFLADLVSPFVEWVPVCPEVEAGFGTPREAMRLVRDGPGDGTIRLMTVRTQLDVTRQLEKAVMKASAYSSSRRWLTRPLVPATSRPSRV